MTTERVEEISESVYRNLKPFLIRLIRDAVTKATEPRDAGIGKVGGPTR